MMQSYIDAQHTIYKELCALVDRQRSFELKVTGIRPNTKLGGPEVAPPSPEKPTLFLQQQYLLEDMRRILGELQDHMSWLEGCFYAELTTSGPIAVKGVGSSQW